MNIMPRDVAPISAVQPMSTSGAMSIKGSAAIALGMMKPRISCCASTSSREYHHASAEMVASFREFARLKIGKAEVQPPLRAAD
jgi:hypothetical protein